MEALLAGSAKVKSGHRLKAEWEELQNEPFRDKSVVARISVAKVMLVPTFTVDYGFECGDRRILR
jgi:hypothetical protein